MTIIYNANWKNQKMFMILQWMRTAWLTQPNNVTLKDVVQQDNLIQLKTIAYFETKKTQKKI